MNKEVYSTFSTFEIKPQCLSKSQIEYIGNQPMADPLKIDAIYLLRPQIAESKMMTIESKSFISNRFIASEYINGIYQKDVRVLVTTLKRKGIYKQEPFDNHTVVPFKESYCTGNREYRLDEDICFKVVAKVEFHNTYINRNEFDYIIAPAELTTQV